jgi:hypothetical protein
MNKGLGLGAMVLAILAILVPVVTIYVVWLALILATIAVLMGDRVYFIVTVLISIVNLVFLSPMTLALLKGENLNGESSFLYGTIALLAAPIGAMIFSIVKTHSKKEGEA